MNIRIFFLSLLCFGLCLRSLAQDKSIDVRLGEEILTKIYINGHNIRLPCKLSDLQRAGWRAPADSLITELAPYQPTSKRRIRLVNKDGHYLLIRFYNPYPQPIPVKDCFIYTISTYDSFQYGIGPEDYYHAPNFKVCGLKSKKATPEDIMKTCGEFLAKRQFNVRPVSDEPLEFVYPFYEEGIEEDNSNNALYLTISNIKDYYPGKLIVLDYMCLGDLRQKDKYTVPYKISPKEADKDF